MGLWGLGLMVYIAIMGNGNYYSIFWFRIQFFLFAVCGFVIFGFGGLGSRVEV